MYDPSNDEWRVDCEMCGTVVGGIVSRRVAVAVGHEHASECHQSANEYAFRVRLIRPRVDALDGLRSALWARLFAMLEAA